MKAIVLCGGLGTRLGELTRQTPKPMLEVAGRPFISHVLDRLAAVGTAPGRSSVDGVDAVVLAAGFAAPALQTFVGSHWRGLPVQFSLEDQPLGTGGAIALAMNRLALEQALVLNGDTLFDIDLLSFLKQPQRFPNASVATFMAMRQVEDCSRFGRVECDASGRVLRFGEKGNAGPGWINGGIYLQQRSALARFRDSPFSFETDYLAADCTFFSMQGVQQSGYFIDIGVPDDLQRAQTELAALPEGAA
jgi:D-glycero-alpha-D-manno-heptose 1-phosphate guanylyltransferase